MAWKVLITAPYMQSQVNRFKEFFEENDIEIDVPKVDERMEEEKLLDIIHKYDGVVSGDDEFTEPVLEKAEKLKVISKWGTGIDSINSEAAEKHNVKIYNTPDAFSNPVADTVLGLILTFSRNIIKTNNMMRNGKWEKIKGKSLTEQTLGIIGVGNVGSQVARRANSFNMKILGNDIRKIKSTIKESHNINMVTKEEIFKEADFISLNCNLNKTSYHLLTEKEFEKMEKEPVIINTSRGPVIKEEDLIKALKEHKISGAGLDVFEKEPVPKDSPLRKMDNVILSPHNANSSPKYWNKVHQNTLNNLLKGLKNEKEQNSPN